MSDDKENPTHLHCSRPVISIIIVAYKSVDEIRGCLESIPEKLMGRPIETIVVDNFCNNDGIHDLIKNRLAGVKYVNPSSNLGFGKANNLGYQRSAGEFVLFLNPDTILRKEALELCLRRLIEDENIGLISPRLLTENGEMDLACRRSIPTIWDGFCRASGLSRFLSSYPMFSRYNLLYLDESLTYSVGAINGAFMMGKRQAFEDVGLFDEGFFMYGDDLDLCYRFGLKGYDIVYDGSEWITHLKGVSVAKDSEKMQQAIFDANLGFYLKHFNPRNNKIVAFKYRFFFGMWKCFSIMVSRLVGRRNVKPV